MGGITSGRCRIGLGGYAPTVAEDLSIISSVALGLALAVDTAPVIGPGLVATATMEADETVGVLMAMALWVGLDLVMVGMERELCPSLSMGGAGQFAGLM